VIVVPSVWLLTVCEVSCSSVHKYKFVLLCYSCKESGGNRCQLVLRDHVCKVMVQLIEAGITHIPIASGSDCGDLPIIVVRLSDGHSQRNSVAFSTVGALIHYFVTMQCSCCSNCSHCHFQQWTYYCAFLLLWIIQSLFSLPNKNNAKCLKSFFKCRLHFFTYINM